MKTEGNGKWDLMFKIITVLILPLQAWILSTIKNQGEHLIRIETEVKATMMTVVQMHANVDDLMIRTYHLEKNKP